MKVLSLSRFLFCFLVIVLFLSNLLSATQINMRDADIRAFSSDIAKISNKTIILDPRVKGNVTVISDQDLDPLEAYAVFLSVLRLHGYSAIENNNVVKVMPESGARQDASFNSSSLDSLTTEVIRLLQANAKTIAPLLKPLVNKQGHIAAYEPTNSIIIADYVGNVARIKKVLTDLDANPGDTFELVELKNISAGEVARIIGSAYSGNSESFKNFTALAVETSNSILLRGQLGTVKQIKKVIESLDYSTSQNSNLKVIYLKYANASEIKLILEKVATSLENEKSATDGSLLKTTSIEFHEDTNAIIISAKPDILSQLETVIFQLDIRRAQVLVEAIIVEISDRLARDLGVQFLFTGDGENTPIAAQRFGSPSPDLISAIASESGSISNSSLAASAANSLLGIEGLAVGVGKINSEGDSFATIINLVAQDADSNILSTPSIMTLDNEEASIVVGQEIPITTGETLSSNNSNPFRSVNRQEVGIKLQVTPQINEGNAVRLSINQEVSSVYGPITELSTDLITNKRVITTTVLVEDGDIIVLGGLIDEDVQETKRKVPFLGDIPLLGRLFQSSSSSITKRNLMVFVKPTIVRDSATIRSITNSKYNYFEAMQNLKIEKGEKVPNLQLLKEKILKN